MTSPRPGSTTRPRSSRSPTGSTNTPGICNITMQNSATVSISLYVSGNLCFQNTSSVAENDNPSDGVPEDVNLEVLGRIVWQNGSSKGVGDTSISSPTNGAVTTAKVGGGCAT